MSKSWADAAKDIIAELEQQIRDYEAEAQAQYQVLEAERRTVERLKAREQELLGTCNKYLQEVRDARAELRVSQLSERLLRDELKRS